MHRNEATLIGSTPYLERSGEMGCVVIRDADFANNAATLELEDVLKLGLKREFRVEPVVLPQINDVNTETIARALRCGHEIIQTSVSTPLFAIATGDSAFGGNQDLILLLRLRVPCAKSLRHKSLIVPDLVPRRCIDVCGIQKCDACVEARMNSGNSARLAGVLCDGRTSRPGHVHTSQANGIDLPRPQSAGCHDCSPSGNGMMSTIVGSGN